ncbi:MAG: 23S rRNA (pseudouridine(1915)-N(3))-methyltransferase RlmH [Bacteroidota bacterium]
MTIKLLVVGKTENGALGSLILEYARRLKYYIRFEMLTIPQLKNTKNLSKKEQRVKEGELILKQVENSDYLVLLDENGKQYTSVDFAGYLQKKMNSGLKNIVFIIGGPYGFDEVVKERANTRVSLSKMTFSHQMVRLFFMEQLYRAFTILKNEPYHHQ